MKQLAVGIVVIAAIAAAISLVATGPVAPFDRIDVLTQEERADYYSIVGPGVQNCPDPAVCRDRLAELAALIRDRLDN